MLVPQTVLFLAFWAPPAAPAVDKMLGLFKALQAAEAEKLRGVAPARVSFSFTEGEINEYMQYSLGQTSRPGVKSVTVKLFPRNYISTFTVLDLDAVERWKPGTIPSLLRPLLNGQKTLWVDYRFQTRSGTMTFTVEKSYYQNVRLPALLEQEIIHIVAARQPEKYDTFRPMPLPFGVREVTTADHTVAGTN